MSAGEDGYYRTGGFSQRISREATCPLRERRLSGGTIRDASHRIEQPLGGERGRQRQDIRLVFDLLAFGGLRIRAVENHRQLRSERRETRDSMTSGVSTSNASSSAPSRMIQGRVLGASTRKVARERKRAPYNRLFSASPRRNHVPPPPVHNGNRLCSHLFLPISPTRDLTRCQRASPASLQCDAMVSDGKSSLIAASESGAIKA